MSQSGGVLPGLCADKEKSAQCFERLRCGESDATEVIGPVQTKAYGPV